jgi:hypothetical protein
VVVQIANLSNPGGGSKSPASSTSGQNAEPLKEAQIRHPKFEIRNGTGSLFALHSLGAASLAPRSFRANNSLWLTGKVRRATN